MAHYIERYATSTGFRYEIGTVTNTGGLAPLKLLYNAFLVYVTSYDTWSFPIDPFIDFTTLRILGISSKKDIFGDLNVFDGDFSVDGAILGASLVTTNGPNKPVDNNDASMPSVGIGGFSYAHHSSSRQNAPSITIGSGGTWVYVSRNYNSHEVVASPINTGRVAGGSTISGSLVGNIQNNTGYLYVIAWRIA